MNTARLRRNKIFYIGHRWTQINTDFIFAKGIKTKDIMGHG
jgi:hypothetical protein